VTGGIMGGVGGFGFSAIPGMIVGGLGGGAIGAGSGALLGGTAGGASAFLTTADIGARQESGSSTTVDTVTTTSSSGERDVSAEMAQSIVDRTHQHASTSRNKHASIVQEVAQQENEQISTRVLTNYNHMHALTMHYFEVVQVYDVRTTLVGAQDCLYIPFLPIRWTEELVAQFRDDILQVVLNTDVAYALLAPERGVTLYSPTYPDIPEKTRENWLGIIPDGIAAARASDSRWQQLHEARKLLGSFVSADPLNAWRIPDHFVIRSIGVSQHHSHQHEVKQNLKYEMVLHYRDGSRHVTEVAPDTGHVSGLPDAAIRKLTHITYEISPRNEGVDLSQFSEDITGSANAVFVLEEDMITGTGSNEYAIRCPAYFWMDTGAISDNKLVCNVLAVRNRVDLADVIEHLNAHTDHYTRQVLLKRNNPLVQRVLSNYSFEGRSLADQVDPEPVAITGNDLIFLLHEAQRSDRGAASRYTVGAVSNSSRVPVGTGGVFAEAVQGRANAAEKLDISRFWDWQASPIPIVAPEIAPISSGSRATPSDVRPGSLPAPMAQPLPPQSLPAPQSMPAILQTLSTQMFRDMSGIAQTAQLARTALEQAMEGATATGGQASKNLEQGLGFTKELAGKIIDMNRQFSELIVKSGLQAVGAATGRPFNFGNSSPTNAGLVKNWGEQLKVTAKPGGSNDKAGSSTGHGHPNPSPVGGNAKLLPTFAGNIPNGDSAGGGSALGLAAFGNLLGVDRAPSTVTTAPSKPESSGNPWLLASQDAHPPGALGLPWPAELDALPTFLTHLNALDEGYFVALNIPRNDVLSFSTSDWRDLIAEYWHRRLDLAVMGNHPALTTFHATIDRFYVSLWKGEYLDESAYQAAGGLGTSAIPPEEMWAIPGSLGNDWLLTAGLVRHGQLRAHTGQPISWDIAAGEAPVRRHLEKISSGWRQQITNMQHSPAPKAQQFYRDMQERFTLWFNRQLADYQRVATLLAPQTETRAAFLDALESGSLLRHTTIESIMTAEGPGPAYISIMSWLNASIANGVNVPAEYSNLPGYLKLLWTLDEFENVL
jgi:hypothetical protein